MALLSSGFCGSCPLCVFAPLCSIRPSGSFLRCLSEKDGSSPRPTGIPTTRAFYGGGSVSLRVSHLKWGGVFFSSCVIRSVCLFSLWPPSARAPHPGCSWHTLPPKANLQSRQRSSWFPLTRLLDSSDHSNGTHVLTPNHAQTESNHLMNWSHPQWL